MSKKVIHIESLLKAAREGDQKAFQEIYERYYDRLIRYGLSMDYEEGLLHDTIQDLFVWLIQHPQKLIGISNLDTYLFKCLRRNINSILQRERGKKNNAEVYQAIQEKEICIEARLIESEKLKNQSSWLISHLDQLSPHQKEVIYLRFYENLSYDEMADIFSVSNQVVRNSVFRALKKLRQNVSKENPYSLKGMFFLFSLFL